MIRDPLLRKIHERLEEGVDPALFERCAGDLLAQVYPALTPVQGGSDGGFDGAIGTECGAYPVICTVGSALIDNARKNLKTFLKSGVGPRRAVIATPRAASPPLQTKLRELGEELDVVIVNVHEREWFANALYRNARWRRELLGVTGDPSSQAEDAPRCIASAPDSPRRVG